MFAPTVPPSGRKDGLCLISAQFTSRSLCKENQQVKCPVTTSMVPVFIAMILKNIMVTEHLHSLTHNIQANKDVLSYKMAIQKHKKPLTSDMMDASPF